MRYRIAAGCWVLLLIASCTGQPMPNATSTPQAILPQPPVAEPREYSAQWHGETLHDPYHWLRDPGYPVIDDADVLGYLNAENDYFDAYMAPREALVNNLYAELKARQPETDSSVPVRNGEYWYQWRFDAGDQYRRWYRAATSAPGDWQLLLDENALSQGHDYFRMGGLQVSPDGHYLAYVTDTAGDERYVLHVEDLRTGERLPVAATALAATPYWSADSQYLIYSRLIDGNWWPNQIRRLAVFGDAAGTDELVLEETDPSFRMTVALSQSRKFLLLDSSTHNEAEVHVLPANAPLAEPQLIAARRTNHNYEVDHRGQRFYIRTNDSHPNYRVVSAPETTPDERHWQTVIAPSSEVTIEGVTAFSNWVVVTERSGGLPQIRLLDDQHQTTHVEFPEPAYDVAMGENFEPALAKLRLQYESMVTPKTTVDVDPSSGEWHPLKVQQIPGGYDASQYVTRRVEVEARDGVKVPVSVVHATDYPLDGSRPMLLVGYGAYGYSYPVNFSADRLSLLQRGFAVAIAHIRGGGEMGKAWYEAGKLKQRTNTFNDFVDAARGLVAAGYVSEGRIAVVGGSAGGSLIGAAVNQAPALWGAAVAHVPFVDVLNTILDASLPLTPPEWAEWGNPVEDAEAFRFLQSYSPYDQLASGEFPPMLVTAGLNDPRVTYWEPAKYVAKLRTLKQGDSVLLLKTNMGAGHGGQSGRLTQLQERAEEYAFVLTELGEQ